ncbi:hypothetical protein LZ32DRAFT_608085 [Colletotrichum eremochloae]|nr:hypothetical protein LZ32DRAFT_608085 [Colletotrichum eremochloae]
MGKLTEATNVPDCGQGMPDPLSSTLCAFEFAQGLAVLSSIANLLAASAPFAIFGFEVGG